MVHTSSEDGNANSQTDSISQSGQVFGSCEYGPTPSSQSGNPFSYSSFQDEEIDPQHPPSSQFAGGAGCYEQQPNMAPVSVIEVQPNPSSSCNGRSGFFCLLIFSAFLSAFYVFNLILYIVAIVKLRKPGGFSITFGLIYFLIILSLILCVYWQTWRAWKQIERNETPVAMEEIQK